MMIKANDDFFKILGEMSANDILDTMFLSSLDYIFKKSKNTFNNKLAWSYLKSYGVAKDDFCEGMARIKWIKGYNFIDINHNIICDKWFDDSNDFCCGFAAVMKNGKWFYINKSGKPINNMKFNIAWDFFKGYALVRNSEHKFNFLKTDGTLYSDKWYELDEIWDEKKGEFFHKEIDCRGFSGVITKYFLVPRELDRKIYYVNYLTERSRETGNVNVLDNLYDAATNFYSGYAVVSDDNKKTYYYIGKDGKPINDDKYLLAYPFVNGIARIYKDSSYNYINSDGKLISETWFDYASDFITADGSLALVEKDGKINYVTTDGKLLFNDFIKKGDIKINQVNSSFTEVIYTDEYNESHTLLKCDSYLDGYEVTEDKRIYKVTDKIFNTSFYVPYKPIAIYGEYGRYTLCLDKDTVYLYDHRASFSKRIGKGAVKLGNINTIEYDKNFIYDKESNTMYLMYGKYMVDITKYYEDKLLCKSEISINDGVFFFDEQLKQDQEKKEVKDETSMKALREIQEAVNGLEQDAKIVEHDETVAQSNLPFEREELLVDKMRQLDSYEKENGMLNKINVDNIFYVRDHHLEIVPSCLKDNTLRRIDLSKESFNNVKVSGIDFRGCNVYINPQKVYNHDLSNSNFEGIYFPVSADFTDVNVCGSKFTNTGNPRIFDINENNFIGSKYDDNTTLNGIPVKELLNEKNNTSRRV